MPPSFSEPHSLKQLIAIQELILSKKLSPQEALFAATQMVNHGFPDANSLILKLKQVLLSEKVQDYLETLQKRNDAILSLNYLPQIAKDRHLVQQLYQTEGHVFIRGPQKSGRMVVVFTSRFNNFQVSNAVLSALLMDLDVSLLFLKDCTKFGFLKGVTGLGNNIHDVSNSIRKIAEKENVSQIYVTGFSSGGYASLYTHHLLPSAGYVGFSIVSDLSADSKYPAPKNFAPDIRVQVDQAYMLNLRSLFLTAHGNQRASLYYGERENMDAYQANNLQGLENFEFTKVINCGHEVPGTLLERGVLHSVFASMINFKSSDAIKH